MSIKTTLKPEDWYEDNDKWFISIPFECDEGVDTIIEFTDDSDYIDEHKDDFDALNNGTTENNKCTISADHKIECDINIEIKTLEEAGGEILYEKDGTPKYVNDNNNFDFASLFAGMTPELTNIMNGELPNINSEGVIEGEAKVVDSTVEEK